ncbi:MAG: SMC-Scp complex subunit ScpB [Planctomycetota bacterium]
MGWGTAPTAGITPETRSLPTPTFYAMRNRTLNSLPNRSRCLRRPSGWVTAPSLPRRPYGVLEPSAPESASTDRETAVDDEDPSLRRMRLEAVLMVAKTPLTTRKLAQLALLADGTEARTLIADLNQLYDRLGRSVRIEKVAGGLRMLTRSKYAPWLTRLGHLPGTVRLSPPMMETLAVVAYRGPVSRADIESVRGVACGELLRQLMERDLIRIAGRSEELGRPYLYDTTKYFLQLFGLPSADALPDIQWDQVHDDSDDPVHADHESVDPEPNEITESVVDDLMD